MYYHVRITQKWNRSHDETKLDFSEEQLRERIVAPYERGEPITINGTTIATDDIERIRISRSTHDSGAFINRIRAKDAASPVVFIGGPSLAWRAADLAEDITDEVILGPPGNKAANKGKAGEMSAGRGSQDVAGRHPFRVFVGSTFEDLQLYRAAVLEALHSLELAVAGMEYFGSQPQDPIDACLSAVASCHAYVGIFAMRYGTVDPIHDKSITQLEYEEAQRRSLPSLIYLIDEERQPILPRFVDTGSSAERLRELKRSLKKRHVVSFFTTPDDLAKRIVLDLPPLAERFGAEVRQSELAKIIEAVPRIDWLTEERFGFLVREMGPLAEEVPDKRVLQEVLEFILSGDRQAAVFLLCRTSHPNIRAAIDFAIQVESTVSRVIDGGMRILQESQGLTGNPAVPGASPEAGTN